MVMISSMSSRFVIAGILTHTAPRWGLPSAGLAVESVIGGRLC
jgi:hypothetical protein